MKQLTQINMKTLEIKQEKNKFGIITTFVKIGNNIDSLLSTRKVTEKDFYQCTLCNFTSVNIDNFKADYKSDSGSEYMYTNEGVYRKSNHWFEGVASCSWLIDGEMNAGAEIIGFAKYEDFKSYSNDFIGYDNCRKNTMIHEKIKESINGNFVSINLIKNIIKN